MTVHTRRYHGLSHAAAAADDLTHGPLRIYAQVVEFRGHELPENAHGDIIVCWGEDEEEVAQAVRAFAERGHYSSYRIRYAAGPPMDAA